jgi:DNA-binding NarL/FixJ family response regulator
MRLLIYDDAGSEVIASSLLCWERTSGRVRRLLRAAGAPVPRARRSAAAVSDILRAYGVTRREADILAPLAAGLTNADIAGQLYLSGRTVESHVSSLLAKLGLLCC